MRIIDGSAIKMAAAAASAAQQAATVDDYATARVRCVVPVLVVTRGPIYRISYDLSYDYCKFIVRSTYDSDLKRAEISLRSDRPECAWHGGVTGNESVPIQLAQCWFPGGLAISNDEI